MAARSPELFNDNGSDAETTASDELPPCQNPNTKPNDSEETKFRAKRNRDDQQKSNKRKCSLSEKIKQSKEAISKLKLNTNKKKPAQRTSATQQGRQLMLTKSSSKKLPKSKGVHNNKEYLRVITKFHYRDIDRLQRQQKQVVKNEISTHSVSRTNVTELDVTKFESLQQELRELKQLLKDKSF